MEATIINFCPTGMLPTTAQTPYIPVTPSQIIEQVHEAWSLGITIAHLHAREEDEQPSYRKPIYQEIFEGVRKHCPGLVICGSSSGRNYSEFEKRSAVIELQPDMCSLTLSSLNFYEQASLNSPDMIIALAEKMNTYGVKPELECFHIGMINYGKYLIHKGILQGPYYWNLLFGNIAGFQANLLQMGAAITELKGKEHYIAIAGIGQSQLAANAIAIANGYGVRVGLEDNIWYDRNREIKASNINLLKRIHLLMEIHERELFNAADFGKLGFYNAHTLARI
ncbi:MAG TPA: 3-keto-5-aminohexanoate cleavage protein [Chitinophagaceae bacterium]|nr:3-keto-5-aminohexanoate cleavage protein [Chitinophagaceae bacterium]